MNGSSVEHAWSLGRERFPGVNVALDVFEAHVLRGAGARAPEDWSHGSDLYLACACEGGDRVAHEHLAALLLPIVRAIASRFAGRGPAPDELLALVLERLLLARTAGPARIASYDGSHALGAWARVIALRLALDSIPRSTPERTLESAVLDSLYAIDGDPELLAQRSLDGRLVRGVIEAACRSLDPRSRRMLRHSLVEGLTVDEIGTLYGVHRATAARHVRRALGMLVAGARGELGGLGDPTPADLSRVDLSLERWLQSTMNHAQSA